MSKYASVAATNQQRSTPEEMRGPSALGKFTHFSSQAQAQPFIVSTLTKVVGLLPKGTTCAIFDIDGTILRDRENAAPVCNRMLRVLFELCKQLHIPVYIVTARPEGRDQRAWTIDQLNQCGYPPGSYTELRMMPVAEWKRIERDGAKDGWNFSNYKFQERQRIVERSRRVLVLNIGDQWTDLLRVPPCTRNSCDLQVHRDLSGLPNSGVYVGTMIDLSWISVKLVH